MSTRAARRPRFRRLPLAAKPAAPCPSSPRLASPRLASPRLTSPRLASPRLASPRPAPPPTSTAPAPRLVPGSDGLNERVAKIVALAAEVGPEKAKVEVTALEAVKKGAVVYKHRAKWLVVFYSVVCAYWLTRSPSPGFLLASLALWTVFMDFYGAVLHVVLDTPDFIWLPAIGEGALEFQWHHSIPRDIVSKDFLEVCGDLNWVCFLHLAWHLYLFGLPMQCHAANTLLGVKLLMAYLGQWSHRMAHELDSNRPAWVKIGQRIGLLLPPEVHQGHHTSYDDGFPILNGLTLNLVRGLRRVMPDPRAWLVLFAVLSLGDVYALTHIMTRALNLPLY